MAEALPLQPGDPRGLGEYEITGRLGVGEHGAVFLGRDRSGRSVAVKLLHLRLSGGQEARDAFAEAFAAARRVSGFCTAAILDAAVEGDRPYVVSEWVDGPSLTQLVTEEGPRGAAVVERLAVGTAVALAAIHRAGAVHHDFKPANILLGRDGPRVSDVAVAPALRAVDAAATGRSDEDPSYRAPEQLSGMGVGPAADVFAWAATLLFAASGRPPFGEGSPSEVMQRIMYDEPDVTALPEVLRGTVTAALAKDPAARPTAAGLLERLLDDSAPLAARMPEALAAEGRALAKSSPASAAQPQPQPQPASASAPDPAPAPSPAPSPGAPSAPSPAPAAEPPSIPPSIPPATPPSVPPSVPLGAPAPPSGSPFSGDLRQGSWSHHDDPDATRVDTPRIGPFPEDAASPEPATQAMSALPPAPAPDPADRTEPTPHLIPGLGTAHGHDERDSTAILSIPPEEPRRGMPPFLASLTRFKPGNHLLGVALSLTIGVLVGVAIIALVLWPQLRGEDDGPPRAGQANAVDDRPVTAVPEGFAGTWKGTAVNSGRGASFPIEVTFEPGTKTARAVYPQNRCAGTLTFTKGTNRTLQMTLAIPKPCTSGTVKVTRQQDGSLVYAWSAGSGQYGYQGKLTRG
ncbi:serine/threonine protein kinase [Actinomadura viridis]|uniref:serine/threonine protein kinase n=1 Tax=Actinomadura viridis TaxID=58110 RepID=UPI003687CE90